MSTATKSGMARNDDALRPGAVEEFTGSANEVPWNFSAAETEEVKLPSLWLSIRAVIDGDGDAPALVNVAAIPKPSGPVKLAVVPMDGGGVEVQTFTMARETYLALAAALSSALASCQEVES